MERDKTASKVLSKYFKKATPGETLTEDFFLFCDHWFTRLLYIDKPAKEFAYRLDVSEGDIQDGFTVDEFKWLIQKYVKGEFDLIQTKRVMRDLLIYIIGREGEFDTALDIEQISSIDSLREHAKS